MIKNRLSHSLLLLVVVAALLSNVRAHANAVESELPTDRLRSRLTAVAGQVIMNSHAYENLEELSDQIGGRLTGSPEAERAVAWGLRKMQAMGLENVHTEKWQLRRGWKRISASAEMISPIRRALVIDSMGWVGSTPADGVEASVVSVNAYRLAEEVRENAPSWAGNILLLVRAGEPPAEQDPLQRFGALGEFLKSASAAHAAAVILSQGNWETGGMHLTHTAVLGFDAYFDLPVVSMVPEDRSQLERFLHHKESVRLKLSVRNQQTQGSVESSNVVGEIRGTEHSEQIILLGAHLDSWDLAQGSTDDGMGVSVTLGAAEAIIASGQRPKRTLRFVLFTGEEQGLLGSSAYVKTHTEEWANHLAAIVLDNGQGPVTKINLGGRKELVSVFETFAASLQAFGTIAVNDKMNFDTDCGPFTLAGLPGINLEQESPQYQFTHHSAADTLDTVEPALLLRNTACMALLGFWIADRDERLAGPWPPEKTARMLREGKLDAGLKAVGLWTFDDDANWKDPSL